MNREFLPEGRIHSVFQFVAITATVFAFAQVTLGGIVRVTESGLGCPDWPLCHGRIVPPLEITILIEYSHRISALALSVLILATALLAWRFYRFQYWIVIPCTVGLVLVLLAAVLGGITVLTELAWWIVLLHLGVAELVIACLVTASVFASKIRRSLQYPGGITEQNGRFNTLVVVTMVSLFVLILSGSYMVGYGAGSSCGSWPLCGNSLLPTDTSYMVHMGHRLVAMLVGCLLLSTAFASWGRKAEQPELAWAGLTLGLLFAVQIGTGAWMVWSGFMPQMKAIHLSLATLVWTASILLATLKYSPQRVQSSKLRPSQTR